MLGRQARQAVEKYYTWDKTIKIWENHLDSIELTGNQGKWDIPRRNIKNAPQQWPEKLNNPDFIDWEIINVLQTLSV
jgi:hypothetical protein